MGRSRQSIRGYKDLQQGRGRLPKYVGAKTKCDGCNHRLRRGEKVQVFHRGASVRCTRVLRGDTIFTPSCATTYGIIMVVRRKSRMIAKRDAIYHGPWRTARRGQEVRAS